MCGIFGYMSSTGFSASPEVVRNMGLAIRHRGPDDIGVALGDNWAIGNMRLSIIDIAGGHQPFVSDDGKISVVQNGEIFNYKELAEDLRLAGNPCRTNSDTEVILRLYEQQGIEFVSQLNGMFAIAIRDERKKITYLIRDRIGVKPLYWVQLDRCLVFSSEIKSFLKFPGFKVRLDHVALSHYLSFNYVPTPHTIFSGVQHVPAGHYMVVSDAGLETKQWWNLTEIQPDPMMNPGDCIEEFNFILEDAVRLRMRCDVPFGAFLSGGVDSSTIVGLMAKYSSQPVKTFCIGFTDPRFDESVFAQMAADRFSTQHVTEIVNANMLDLWPMTTYHCDQPHGDVSFLPTYKVSHLAAKQTKVVLTGDGGDELFAGYDKYRDFFSSGQNVDCTSDVFLSTYFDSISLFNSSDKSKLLASSGLSHLDKDLSLDLIKPFFDRVQHQDRINQILLIDMNYLLSGNNLVKPDRMGMAVSLEARTPFLDYRMMEFAFRVPGHLKLNLGETKYIYKKAVEPLIGRELAYRKKQMFTVPVGEWFKKELKEYCRAQLMSLNSLNPFEGLRLLDEHVNGSANRTREIRALIALSHWEKAFGVAA